VKLFEKRLSFAKHVISNELFPAFLIPTQAVNKL